jgi:Ser/Thr protein kinase RdoA (MazF antagonist)
MTRPTRAAPTPASYSWLFRAGSRLHRAFATLDLAVPRPLIATYAPPGSLRRWLPITEAAAQDDVEARDIVRYTYELVRRLRQQWVPARLLPRHLVHGDVRLGNICRSPASDTIYLDFGFLAVRPRIHELAYSLAFMVLASTGYTTPPNSPGRALRSVSRSMNRRRSYRSLCWSGKSFRSTPRQYPCTSRQPPALPAIRPVNCVSGCPS